MFAQARKTEQKQQSNSSAVSQRQTQTQARLTTPVQAPIQQQSKPNKTGLPDNLKTGMENLSGVNLDHVKVHYNSSKPATVQAHAYAQGSDIHLAPGQQSHLPHELGHVVQQAQGRVKPTTQVNGAAVNDNPSLEREADVLGAKAMQLASYDQVSNGVQNRLLNAKDNTLQLSSNEKNSQANEVFQLYRSVTHPKVNFTFDNKGDKTYPGQFGATAPIARSHWPNEMIANNLITHDNNDAMYQSGHQIAHRFGGADDDDNVAAWPDRQEAVHSTYEDRIDFGNDNDARKNEHGELSVKTGYHSANTLVNEMADVCLEQDKAELTNTANWDNLNAGSDLSLIHI